MVSVAGFEPAAPLLPKQMLLAWLSYTLMTLATSRGIEPRFTDRQSGVLPLDDEAVVRAGRFERPLDSISSWRLCRLGYARDLENHRRFEPRPQEVRVPPLCR